MGRNKSKKSSVDKSAESAVKQTKSSENSPRAYDKDTAMFISMSQELKDEGNRLFQKRDYEGAMLKYEKAIKLLPRNHIDVSYLRSNMAACYMQLGISEYPRAIHECNLALEVTPKYSKALLKRARCYEALNRFDLALRDVGAVLVMEPNNLMAIEIGDRVKKITESLGSRANGIPLEVPLPEYIEQPSPGKASKEKLRRKKSNVGDKNVNGLTGEKNVDGITGENNDNGMTGEKNVNGMKVEKNVDGMKGEKSVDGMTGEKNVNGMKWKKILNGMTVEKNVNGMTGEKNANGMTGEKNVNAMTEENKNLRTGDEKEMKGELEQSKADDDDVVIKKPGNQIAEKKSNGKSFMKCEELIEEKNSEDKLVVEEEKISNGAEEEPKRTVKLVYGEDIRWAQIPLNCNVLKLREIISDRFPNSKSVLVKYRDQEGDLVTITTTEELRWAEASTEHGSVKLYIVSVNPDQDPLYKEKIGMKHRIENALLGKRKEVHTESTCVSDWIVQFAQFFRNYVGFDVDTYLDLHEGAVKLYSEAIEEVVTSEEAQDLFNSAADKFQEMAALALFNWGNVHMSRARKRIYFSEDYSRESVLAQVKCAYDWAKSEYVKAGKRYEEALKIKPSFYEAVLALGQQQFEQAKLSWYYAIGTNVKLELWPSTEVLQLYNNAEENMEKGMLMWEEAEAHLLSELKKPNKVETLLQTMKLDNVFKHASVEEATEQAANVRSQIYVLWGTILYERSVMEYKLGLPVWQESLEVAVEKFELAGASPTDLGVMIKNHCSNNTASEGLGFNIDEIVQAWNEMYEAKRLQNSFPSFRLEPLLRRRVSNLYYALEHA